MNSSQIKGHLKELCLIPGLSGYEDNVRKYLQQQLNLINVKSTTDILGNLICTLPGEDNYPSVMLFAHMDQLGFIVKKIEEDGFIRVERLGGIPEKALASQEVVIQTKKGNYINALIGNKSHHATSVEERYKVIFYKDLFVDAGFSNKEEVLDSNSLLKNDAANKVDSDKGSTPTKRRYPKRKQAPRRSQTRPRGRRPHNSKKKPDLKVSASNNEEQISGSNEKHDFKPLSDMVDSPIIPLPAPYVRPKAESDPQISDENISEG